MKTQAFLIGVFTMPYIIASATGQIAGKMKMWSSAENGMASSSCGFAGSAIGGFDSPAAKNNPYIQSRHYCAVAGNVMQGGLACGRCYRITFDGQDTTETTGCTTAGSAVVQVVNRNMSPNEFDCHKTVFEQISGCDTGEMGIQYEEVECEGTGPLTATVLSPTVNKWWTKILFSGGPRAVSAASITIGGDDPVELVRTPNSATWYASTPEATSGNIPVTFTVTLDNNEPVELTGCFDSWAQPTGAFCTAHAGPESHAELYQLATSNSNPGASDSSTCLPAWSACDEGAGNCCVGTQCFKEHDWYSQCRESCPEGVGWACESDRRHLRGLK